MKYLLSDSSSEQIEGDKFIIASLRILKCNTTDARCVCMIHRNSSGMFRSVARTFFVHVPQWQGCEYTASERAHSTE